MTAADCHACGDDLITIPADGPAAAQRIARHLRRAGHYREVVAGMASVVVQFDTAVIDPEQALLTLRSSLDEVSPGDESEPASIEIPVVYGGHGGPDFDALCGQLGLSREQFIALHTRDEYRVEMLGFTPGFAYIGGLDDKLDVPRLATPRQRVAAGSIGIAGGRTGVYALAGPGGWPLIGRTSLTLFDRGAAEPFLIEPGMRVRFRAVAGPGP